MVTRAGSHHDGGDVEKVGKSFAAWKRKARKAWD